DGHPERAAADQDGDLSGPHDSAADAADLPERVIAPRPGRRGPRLRGLRAHHAQIQVGGQPPALPAARYQPIVDIGRFPLLLLYLPVGVGNCEAGNPLARAGIGRGGRHLTPRTPDLAAQVLPVAAPLAEKDALPAPP